MKRRRTVASVHNDWLSLVEPVGAFLTLPVLKRALPNGIAPLEADLRAEVRQRLDSLGRDVAARTGWLQFLLRDLLGWGDRLREDLAVPAHVRHTVAERHTFLRPTFALIEPVAGQPDRVRLVGVRWPLGTKLDARPSRDEQGRPTDWAATPIERAATLCRAANVPLALVTDTDRFALVWAPVKGPTGHAIFPSALFGEERLLLDAFVAVLGAQRFFAFAEGETLESLLHESGSAQAEVTDRLGRQVRSAVELLVGAFSRADRSARGALFGDVQPVEVYNAAVTVMMRLVVLLAAEERRLLPADDAIYSASYSVLTARDQLERDAQRDGVETLEKRHTAWHRLLATFRAVHDGIDHDRLRLPAYGGGLFDPRRYPFLDSPPIPVDDRTTLAVLDALQVLTFRIGGVTEARRLSYRNLSVEEIGHVYEGLLDHGCARVGNDIVLGMLGSKGDEPEIRLSDLERELRKGDDAFAAWLAEHGGPTAGTTKKRLFAEAEPEWDHRLRAACDNDDAIYDRVLPFAGLLREDLRGMPAIFLPGTLYVTQTSLRRDSGTAYTTPELADEVVKYTLEPLVYSPGPAEGADPAEWKLKSSAQLLQLKVCDPAVGSGAILVAACRFLADRLVEAWQGETGQGARVAMLEGVPESEWVRVARQAVTDRCLYGVDRNPMALEMAKLSLWLTTMAKERPFTFLDHQLRCGDSLLGVTSLDQVRWVHLDPARGEALWTARPLFDARKAVDLRVDAALEKARQLAAVDVRSLDDVEKKRRLHEDVMTLLSPLEALADVAVGAALAAAGGEGAADDEDDDERPAWLKKKRGGWQARTDNLLAELADQIDTAFDETATREQSERALGEIRDKSSYWLDTGRPELALDRRCLHWRLAFPEVFLADGRSGFDAIVGNPPFLGGQRITGALGTPYRDLLVEALAKGKRGSADLVSYFYLRAFELLQTPGAFGLLATNTIAQGDTREVGLDSLVERGATITRAVPSEPWPGTTSLEIAKVWIAKGDWRGMYDLSGTSVKGISPMLIVPGRVSGTPYRLKANENKSFQGSIVLGMGFVMQPHEAQALIKRDQRNQEVLFEFLNGEDLNSRPDQSPSRWVINFRDWPLDRSGEGRWNASTDDERRLWLRSGSVPSDYPGSVASDYPDALALVKAKVKTERDKLAHGDATARDRARRWWQFGRPTMLLYSTIEPLRQVIAVAATSRTLGFAMVPSTHVFSHATYVFAFDDPSVVAVLQSTVHDAWARERASSMKGDLRYTPTDCFETFPMPELANVDQSVANEYMDLRLAIATADAVGLTRIYTHFHDRSETSASIKKLRELQVQMDRAVLSAYGWEANWKHDFHQAKDGLRFGIVPDARRELLELILELNHQRYAEEVAAGLHDAAKSKSAKGSNKARGRKPKAERQIVLPTD